jgi:hypothetical protein
MKTGDYEIQTISNNSFYLTSKNNPKTLHSLVGWLY